MLVLKKIIAVAAAAAALFMFPCKAYSGNEGAITYYKDNMSVEERVVFDGALSPEQKAFILLSVLIYNKTDNAPKNAKLAKLFADRGELFIYLKADELPDMEEYGFSQLTEEMTKTACSVEGIDSIIISVDDSNY